MTYCWKCTECKYKITTAWRHPVPMCENSQVLTSNPAKVTHGMVRDYREEAVGIETFTSALGDGKVEARRVKPGEDRSPRT